ncbi:hypothetical protein AnigIFM63309_007497 [Aspergillus niger]|nr:hypothetical protein AnigIFM63309_007497 [Aspergillus niger]
MALTATGIAGKASDLDESQHNARCDNSRRGQRRLGMDGMSDGSNGRTREGLQEADWLGGETREAGCKRHHSDREQFWAVIRGEAADGSAEHGLGRGHERAQEEAEEGERRALSGQGA